MERQEKLVTSAIRPSFFQLAPAGLARGGSQRVFLEARGLAAAPPQDSSGPIQVLQTPSPDCAAT